MVETRLVVGATFASLILVVSSESTGRGKATSTSFGTKRGDSFGLGSIAIVSTTGWLIEANEASEAAGLESGVSIKPDPKQDLLNQLDQVSPCAYHPSHQMQSISSCSKSAR
jgi:hypothetical protein